MPAPCLAQTILRIADWSAGWDLQARPFRLGQGQHFRLGPKQQQLTSCESSRRCGTRNFFCAEAIRLRSWVRNVIILFST